MKPSLEELGELSKEKMVENKKYFQRLKKRTPKNLDVIVREIHDKEFANTNCLDCGNCCKTSSPIFTERDIARISKHLRMKEPKFISTYLDRDEDDFYVLKGSPCTFLDSDNSCFIYDVRPKACSEYPHTNRRKFIQLAELTLKNTEICPAVYNIMETLKEKLPKE
ncbi:MAG: zinc/iron-chelating domain-containing protein [Flavobacteriaceae bacterium]|nr:MAG: zinc/iron-chelating domain-containing protein [Flavobacteriaceae bacterium]